MSIFRPTGDLQRLTGKPRRQGSLQANDAVLCATGALTLMAIGAIHFLQIVETFKATPILGVAYLLLIGACLLVAARLCINGGDQRTWTVSTAVCAAAIGGYIFTRVINSPLDNQDLGNWSCMLGLAALFVEGALLAFSVYAAVTAPAREMTMAAADMNGASDPSVRDRSSVA